MNTHFGRRPQNFMQQHNQFGPCAPETQTRRISPNETRSHVRASRAAHTNIVTMRDWPVGLGHVDGFFRNRERKNIAPNEV